MAHAEPRVPTDETTRLRDIRCGEESEEETRRLEYPRWNLFGVELLDGIANPLTVPIRVFLKWREIQRVLSTISRKQLIPVL